MIRRISIHGILFFIVALLVVTTISCEQYEYASPLPGIFEVRMKVKNSRSELVPFSDLNLFLVRMRSLQAKRDDNVILDIFADLSAIRRNPDGDFFNCLSTLARDSGIVLGRTYAPPQEFTKMELRINPESDVLVTTNLFTNAIPVEEPLPREDLRRLPQVGHPGFSVKIEENRHTIVTVTFDLDSALVRRTESFLYRPYFYVSSVHTF